MQVSVFRKHAANSHLKQQESAQQGVKRQPVTGLEGYALQVKPMPANVSL